MGQYYVSDYNFQVIIDDEVLGFSKVENLELKNQGKILQLEGGNRLAQKDTEMEIYTLKLEKAVLGEESEVMKNLVPGCVIDGFIIIVTDHLRNMDKAFSIDQGVVTKRSYSNLDASSGKPLMMKLEISHLGMKEFE